MGLLMQDKQELYIAMLRIQEEAQAVYAASRNANLLGEYQKEKRLATHYKELVVEYRRLSALYNDELIIWTF